MKALAFGLVFVSPSNRDFSPLGAWWMERNFPTVKHLCATRQVLRAHWSVWVWVKAWCELEWRVWVVACEALRLAAWCKYGCNEEPRHWQGQQIGQCWLELLGLAQDTRPVILDPDDRYRKLRRAIKARIGAH